MLFSYALLLEFNFKPADNDFIIGYAAPVVFSTSGSHKSNFENVKRFVPLTKRRMPDITVVFLHKFFGKE